MITLPEVDLVAGTIPRNPRDTISLKELPNLQVNMNVIGYVNNKNWLPLPVSLNVKVVILAIFYAINLMILFFRAQLTLIILLIE
jgi:hypothetical protein